MAVHYRQDISATTVPLGVYSVLVIAVVRRLYIWVGLWIACTLQEGCFSKSVSEFCCEIGQGIVTGTVKLMVVSDCDIASDCDLSF